MRDPRELARGGVEGRLPSPRTQAGVPPPPTRRMLVVQRGSNSRARPGACSVYESDSAGPLDDRHESRDRQAPRGRTVGAGVVAAFMPKRNSALVGTTAGRSTMRRVWRLANRRSHAGGAARPRFRLARARRRNRRLARSTVRITPACFRAAGPGGRLAWVQTRTIRGAPTRRMTRARCGVQPVWHEASPSPAVVVQASPLGA